MNHPEKYEYAPRVEKILCPTDFSDASHRAFSHALALTMHRHAELIVLHVSADSTSHMHWSAMPSVRDTLERWSCLEPGSSRSDVFDKLAMKVSKVVVHARDAAHGIRSFLDQHDFDLVVLSTEGRRGLPGWFHPSVAENVAFESRTMSLFVPQEAKGFVSPSDGQIHLKKILLPVDHTPDPSPAAQYAFQSALLSDEQAIEIIPLHVRAGQDAPPLSLQPFERPNLTWRSEERAGGDVAEEILAAAQEFDADLIVMPTTGRHGILDAVRGSTTQQVLRRAPCPLLAVPVSTGHGI